uniref:Uncharacterized protein n=1 Tax=Steinernema glaseri TaxID=37863 RepID=A0A1I7YJW4_9BILA
MYDVTDMHTLRCTLNNANEGDADKNGTSGGNLRTVNEVGMATIVALSEHFWRISRPIAETNVTTLFKLNKF